MTLPVSNGGERGDVLARPRTYTFETGQRFGMLTVVGPVPGGWECVCDCGKKTMRHGGRLLTSHSCGCTRLVTCANCSTEFKCSATTQKYCSECMNGKCEWCGVDYKKFSLATRFCSLLCRSGFRHQGKTKVVSCFSCGKEFSRVVCQLTRTERPTCSVECRQRMRWETDRDGILAHFRTDKNRERMRQSRLAQKFPRRSGIERALEQEFLSRGMVFRTQVPMFGRYVPDFVFDDAATIVQADGEYWHGSPKVKAKDLIFDNLAVRAGWRVIRFSEYKINADVAWCVDLVADSVADKRVPVPIHPSHKTVVEQAFGPMDLELLTKRFAEAQERGKEYDAWVLKNRDWYKRFYGVDPVKMGTVVVYG